jgi:hypothetical protein
MSTEDMLRTLAPTAIRGMGGSVLAAAMSAEGSQAVPFSVLTKAPPRFLKAPAGVLSAAITPGIPRGIDLDLNMFDLTEPLSETDLEMQCCSWAVCSETFGKEEPVGHAFWSAIEAWSESAITDSDKLFLRKVFNPSLSDRRDEGELFKAPDATVVYAHKLQNLVNEEQETQDSRRVAFLSEDFNMEDPGSLFPSCWRSSITGGHVASRSSSTLYARPEYHDESSRFQRALKSATPIFDKIAEDSVRFRIYEIGTLQVRTLMRQDGPENIVAFFSAASAQTKSLACDVDEQEGVKRVTQYVDGDASDSRFFVVVDTNAGSCIMTQTHGHEVVWNVNPRDLEARIVLAKVMHSATCEHMETCIGDLKEIYMRQASKMRLSNCSPSKGDMQSYAQDIFNRAVHQPQ